MCRCDCGQQLLSLCSLLTAPARPPSTSTATCPCNTLHAPKPVQHQARPKAVHIAPQLVAVLGKVRVGVSKHGLRVDPVHNARLPRPIHHANGQLELHIRRLRPALGAAATHMPPVSTLVHPKPTTLRTAARLRTGRGCLGCAVSGAGCTRTRLPLFVARGPQRESSTCPSRCRLPPAAEGLGVSTAKESTTIITLCTSLCRRALGMRLVSFTHRDTTALPTPHTASTTNRASW